MPKHSDPRPRKSPKKATLGKDGLGARSEDQRLVLAEIDRLLAPGSWRICQANDAAVGFRPLNFRQGGQLDCCFSISGSLFPSSG